LALYDRAAPAERIDAGARPPHPDGAFGRRGWSERPAREGPRPRRGGLLRFDVRRRHTDPPLGGSADRLAPGGAQRPARVLYRLQRALAGLPRGPLDRAARRRSDISTAR